MSDYQPLPDNPPTSISDPDYYAHRKIMYSALSTHLVVPKPTGVAAQDTQALQSTLDAAVATGKGKQIVLYPGTYVVNATLTIRGVAGLRIIGNGSTIIQSSASPVIKMAHCRECVLDGFTLSVAAGNTGIQCLRDNNPAGLSPTQNTFRNLLIENGAIGIVLGGTGMVDANNDFNLFENVRCNNYTDTGFLLQGSQSYANVFRNCFAFGAVNANYGVNTGAVGGQFQWYSGGMNRNIVDFRIGRHYQPYLIEGVVSENSDRFIERVNEAYGQLIVRGCRWAGNSIHADNRAIVTAGLIQIQLLYNSISDGGVDTATLLDFGTNALNHIEMIGNRVFSTAADVFPGDAPDILEGNIKITNETNNTIGALTG